MHVCISYSSDGTFCPPDLEAILELGRLFLNDLSVLVEYVRHSLVPQEGFSVQARVSRRKHHIVDQKAKTVLGLHELNFEFGHLLCLDLFYINLKEKY